MVLDTEEDRNVLLQIIQSANIPGGAVMVVADLVQRIKGAPIDGQVRTASGMHPLGADE